MATHAPKAAAALDFKVYGLDCAEEASLIKRALREFAAEEHLHFDFLSGRLRIDPRATACTPETVCAAIAGTGMRALPWEEHAALAHAPAPFLQRHARTLFAAASGTAIVLAMLFDLFGIQVR